MKLERLRVRGLRSYVGEVEIDLARLGEEGLFAIFGPTGSGKSTILDGIFLALFGRCPRGEPGDCVSSGALELGVRLEIDIGHDDAPRPLAIERRFRWSKKRDARAGATGPDLRGSTKHMALRIEEHVAGAWAAVDTRGHKPEDYLRDQIVRVSMSDFSAGRRAPRRPVRRHPARPPRELRTLLASLFRTEHLGQPLYDALRAREAEVEREREHLDDDAREVQVTPADLEAARAHLARASAEAAAAAEIVRSSTRASSPSATPSRPAPAPSAPPSPRPPRRRATPDRGRARREAAAAVDRAADRDEHLRACLARITAARARIDDARAAFDHLTADRDARDREQDRDAARTSAADAAARAAQAAARCDELDRRADRTLELHARAALLEPRAHRLAQIRQLVTGNQLAELAADRHLEAVTRGAADLLRLLSSDRYALVRTADGAFAVADSLLGGVIRSPSTLSGASRSSSRSPSPSRSPSESSSPGARASTSSSSTRGSAASTPSP